jgi:PPOX class probable F420-dependent enzyme
MRLSPAESARRLAQADHGVLGTLGEVESIHLVPVCFVVVDGTVAVPIDRVKPKAGSRLQRESDLDLHPRASLLVEHWDDEHWERLWWVRADVRRVTVDPARADVVRRLLGEKYRQYADPDTIASVITFDLDRLSGWSAA